MMAAAPAAPCYSLRRGQRWMIDRSQAIAEAVRLARQAIELGRDDAVALCFGGSHSVFSREIPRPVRFSSIGRAYSIPIWHTRGQQAGG